MPETTGHIALLIHKHIVGVLSDSEKVQLDEWVNSNPANRELLEMMEDKKLLHKNYTEFREQYNSALQNLSEKFQKTLPGKVVQLPASKHTEMDELEEDSSDALGGVVNRKRIHWFRIVAAASIILFVGLGAYLFFNSNTSTKPVAKTEETQPVKHDVQPANGAAVLVLDNGKQIILDSLGNGVIATEAGKQVTKQDGQLAYTGQGDKVVYNTLITNKGKMTQLRLADGSQVWLNAESSIRYPTAFPGSERMVEVTGEVYFEVTKNDRQPFRVQIKKPSGKITEVQVLGTHFNVSAYDTEPIKATLLEGAIAISQDNAKKILAPGQQAAVAESGAISVSDDVNTSMVTAWLNNDFYFKNDNIKTIMRQMARWYDITVKYEGNLADQTYSGQIRRNRSLADVLELLGRTNIQYTIENNVVTITASKK